MDRDQVEDGNIIILRFSDSLIPEIVYILHKSYTEPREKVSELILTLIEADGGSHHCHERSGKEVRNC